MGSHRSNPCAPIPPLRSTEITAIWPPPGLGLTTSEPALAPGGCPRRGLFVISRARPGSLLPGAGTAVVFAPAEDGFPVEIDATRVHQMRAVLGGIAVDDELITELDIALLESSARESTRVCAFTTPRRNIALLVFDIDVEVRMRVGPFDFRQRSFNPHWLFPVEFRREGMMRAHRLHHPQAQGGGEKRQILFHRHIS